MAIIGTTVLGFSSEIEPPFLGGVVIGFLCVFCASCSRCSFSSAADCTLYEMFPYSCNTGQTPSSHGQKSFLSPNHPKINQQNESDHNECNRIDVLDF